MGRSLDRRHHAKKHAVFRRSKTRSNFRVFRQNPERRCTMGISAAMLKSKTRASPSGDPSWCRQNCSTRQSEAGNSLSGAPIRKKSGRAPVGINRQSTELRNRPGQVKQARKPYRDNMNRAAGAAPGPHSERVRLRARIGPLLRCQAHPKWHAAGSLLHSCRQALPGRFGKLAEKTVWQADRGVGRGRANGG